jgi:hypothetical protein
MIRASSPSSGPERASSSRGSGWTAVLWSLAWRLLVVVLLPLMLPSRAEIGAAQGASHLLMAAVVTGFAGAALLGLPLRLWRRPGVLGSCYRVIAAAVAVRLASSGPVALMMTTWMAALGVAAADGLYAAAEGLAARRMAARPLLTSEPEFASPPTQPWVDAQTNATAGHAALRPRRPVTALVVALMGLLGIAVLVWVSNTDLHPQSGPAPPPATIQPQAPPVTSQAPPATSQAQAPPAPRAAPPPGPPPASGKSLCARLAGSSICVEEPPVTQTVVRGPIG